MTNGVRRLTAWMLALALALSMLPAALAAEAETEADNLATDALWGEEQQSLLPESEVETDFDDDGEEEDLPPVLMAETTALSEDEADSQLENRSEYEVEDTDTEETVAAEDAELLAEDPIQDAEDPGADEVDGETLDEEDAEDMELYATGPSIQYGYSEDVQKGTIRYVSQNPGAPYFYEEYWPDNFNPTMYCKSADVSMMLSYLGINMLPRDVMNDGGDGSCMKHNHGGAKVEYNGLSFEQAMDNYLKGNGVYSPVMVRLGSTAYSSGQHFVLVIGKNADGTYQALDPFNRGFYSDSGLWTMTVNGDNITFYRKNTSYDCTFSGIYQYHLEQNTLLSGANKPGNMFQSTAFAPQGRFYGDEILTSVSVGVYDRQGKAQAGCCATVKPNSVGFNLSSLGQYVRLDQLKPGFYRYVVRATTEDGSTLTYVNKYFTVLSTKQTVVNATFYIDKFTASKTFCAVPEQRNKKNNVDMMMTRNTEDRYMRIRANYVGRGYYNLTVVGSGQLLTVYKSQNASGTRVIQNKAVKRNGQYWQILSTGRSGYYYMVPKSAPGCCLALSNGKVTEGTRLQIQTSNQSAAQAWYLRPTRARMSKTLNAAKGMVVQWESLPNATGYLVYRKAAGAKHWTRLGAVKSGKKKTWTDTKAKNGTVYGYTVRTQYGGKLYSPSCPGKVQLRMAVPKPQKIRSMKRGKLTLYWNRNSKATHYQLAYTRKANFSTYKTLTLNAKKLKHSGKADYATISNLARQKVYYVKVRALKKVKGKSYASAWSAGKAVRIHK